MKQRECRSLIYSARFCFNDPVLDLITHSEPVPATNRVRLKDEFDMSCKGSAIDFGWPTLFEGDRDILCSNVNCWIPMRNTHDGGDNFHPG